MYKRQHQFLADLPAITGRYVTESHGGSTGGTPIALAIGVLSVLGLATVDLREAGWLATIVAVPINGWYAGAAAVPLVSPILAAGLALPIAGLPTAAIAVYAVMRVAIRREPGGRAARFLGPLIVRYRPGAEPDRPAWPLHRPTPVHPEAPSPAEARVSGRR